MTVWVVPEAEGLGALAEDDEARAEVDAEGAAEEEAAEGEAAEEEAGGGAAAPAALALKAANRSLHASISSRS
jgi:hypothetical protein